MNERRILKKVRNYKMVLMAWILLIAFGLFSLQGWIKYYINGLKTPHFVAVAFGAIITALSAGIIFGGLFQ